jgi:hypothetical protein
MFGLVSEKVEDEAQRALILVAKVLQVARRGREMGGEGGVVLCSCNMV